MRYSLASIALRVGGGHPLLKRAPFLPRGASRFHERTDIELVRPPHELTSEVSLIDAPGHNWGHLAVRIESQGELAIYPGHQILTPFQIADPTAGDEGNPRRDEAIETRRRLLGELADNDGILLTTLLGGPGGGTVRRDGAGFALVVDG